MQFISYFYVKKTRQVCDKHSVRNEKSSQMIFYLRNKPNYMFVFVTPRFNRDHRTPNVARADPTTLLQICNNGEIIEKRKVEDHFGDLIVYLALFGVPIEKYVTDQLPEKYHGLSYVDLCGKRFYMANAYEICCRGNLFSKPPNAECCGGIRSTQSKLSAVKVYPSPGHPMALAAVRRPMTERVSITVAER